MNINLPERRVALTFMAHPDDAEILCAGTLMRLADAGWEIHIATTANGDCGSATLSREKISELRREEAISAAAMLGGTFHSLDERDVHVAVSPKTIAGSIDLFRKLAPTLVFTHPRRDYMMDHEQTHLLARSATFSFAIPNASDLPLLEGSNIPWLYYCDPVDALDPYTGYPPEPSVVIDITDQLERKSEMLACHASQRDWLRSHHGMDQYIESMKQHSSSRGKLIGTAYGEAFIQHRGHAYPQTDLLAKLFTMEG